MPRLAKYCGDGLLMWGCCNLDDMITSRWGELIGNKRIDFFRMTPDIKEYYLLLKNVAPFVDFINENLPLLVVVRVCCHFVLSSTVKVTGSRSVNVFKVKASRCSVWIFSLIHILSEVSDHSPAPSLA
jgi:hypothetical protein